MQSTVFTLVNNGNCGCSGQSTCNCDKNCTCDNCPVGIPLYKSLTAGTILISSRRTEFLDDGHDQYTMTTASV